MVPLSGGSCPRPRDYSTRVAAAANGPDNAKSGKHNNNSNSGEDGGVNDGCVLSSSTLPSAAAVTANANTAAVFSTKSISHNLEFLDGDVRSGLPDVCGAASGGVDGDGNQTMFTMDFALSGCTVDEWEADEGDAPVRRLENVGHADILDEKPTQKASDENKRQPFDRCQLLQGQRHDANGSDNTKTTSALQASCGSLFHEASGGNTPRELSGTERQSHQSQQQQHHCHYSCNINNSNSGKNNQPHHTQHHQSVSNGRRSRRRRGLGAAAVEAIQRRTLAVASSPKNNSMSSLLKPCTQHDRVECCGDPKSRLSFQVPLPRSKSRLVSTCGAATPVDEGEAATVHHVPDSDLSGTVSADMMGNTIRLSNMAPFCGCAIQQLIMDWERRVANGSEAARGSLCHQSSGGSQRKQPHYSTDTHLLDTQSTLGLGLFSVSPLKMASSKHLLNTQMGFRGGEFSIEKPKEMEESLDLSNAPGNVCCGEWRCEDEISANVLHGGLFTPLSEVTPEKGAPSTMVQQLIASIDRHVAYGEAAPMVLIGALVYLSRTTLQNLLVCSRAVAVNWYRLVAIAILIATKMYIDGSQPWNARFAKATGLSLKEINKMELDFLFLADFDLFIEEKEAEVWVEWMESVARRCGMSTPLRGFILGKSTLAASNTTTPVLSFAGDDAFPYSFTHGLSGNCSTPSSFTPASLTPPIDAHVSPAALKSCVFSRRSPLSVALELAEEQSRPSPKPRPSPSPLLQFCETPNTFLPLLLDAPLASRRTERLFSVVHAPPEPLTPPSLQQLSLLLDDTMTSFPAPPEQEHVSPVTFFKRSLALDRSISNGAFSPRVRCGSNACRKGLGCSDGGLFSDFDELDEMRAPPHRMQSILSPPNCSATLIASVLPEGGRGANINSDSNSILATNTRGAVNTMDCHSSACLYQRPKCVGTFLDAASKRSVFAKSETQDVK